MELSLIGVIIGAVALLGLPIAYVAFRRDHPRRRLIYRVESTRLLSEHAAATRLEVSFAGEPMKDPHVLRLSVRSSSRADISSAAFDANLPVRFKISPEPRVLSYTAVADGAIGFGWSSNIGFMESGDALIEPQLIRRSASGAVVAVTDGPPRVEPENSLADIRIIAD